MLTMDQLDTGDGTQVAQIPARRGYGTQVQQTIAPQAPQQPATAQPQTMAPSYLANLFPNGIPQTNVATAGPAQQVQAPDLISQILAANGSIPQVGADNVSTNGIAGQIGNVNAGSVTGALGPNFFDPSALIKNVTDYMQPQFDRQNRALTESLANAGIVGGSTAGAVGDLAQSQTGSLANAITPYLQAARTAQQQAAATDVGNSLNAGEFNATTRSSNLQSDAQRALQVMLANQAKQLTASGANAGNAIGVGGNSAASILKALQGNQQISQQGNEFDASALNSGNQYDIANLIKAGMYDTGNYNSMQQYLLSMQNQDWLAQLGLQGNLAQGAAGAQAGAYQPVFQQPSPVNFSGLAASLAPTATSQPNPGSTSQPSMFAGGGG